MFTNTISQLRTTFNLESRMVVWPLIQQRARPTTKEVKCSQILLCHSNISFFSICQASRNFCSQGKCKEFPAGTTSFIRYLKLKEGSSTKSIPRAQLPGKHRRLSEAGLDWLQRLPPDVPERQPEGLACKVGVGSATKGQSNQRAGQTEQGNSQQLATLWEQRWRPCGPRWHVTASKTLSLWPRVWRKVQLSGKVAGNNEAGFPEQVNLG